MLPHPEYQPLVLQDIPYGFDHLMYDLLQAGTRLCAFTGVTGWILDALDDYMQAIEDVASGKMKQK